MDWKKTIVDFALAKGPSLLGAVLILFAGFFAGRWIGRVLSAWLTRKDFEPPVRMLITRIAFLLAIGLAAVIAMGTLGFNIMALVTGIGVAGVGLSLATQGVLSNLVAGLMIIFTKPFRVGEYIEVIGVQGQVEMIELMSTKLIHPDRSRVVIPNRKIAGEVLHNYGTIRQLDLSIGVSYDSNMAEVTAIVRDILKNNPRVLKELSPGIGISHLGDSAISVAVKPWVTVPDYGAAGAEIYQALVEKFRDRRIEIPFPQREIRVLNGSNGQKIPA